MPGKKNIGRLVPVKKNVVNKRTGSTNEITYYVDPNKDVKHNKPHKVKDENADIEVNKRENNALRKRGETEPDTTALPNDPRHEFNDVKDFEDFGKKGIDPKAARQFFCNM